MTSIDEWAHSLISGPRLEDKLFSLATLSDSPRLTALNVPDIPAREHRLRSQRRGASRAFPKKSSLAEDSARGGVLHFFTNHELLAIELMALALLKFPNAPKAIRRAIVGTICEEQGHMKLYIARMNELGMGFGDLPLNNYFWHALSPMASLDQYFAGMSLTFEQANLDYSQHYQRVFASLGDMASSAVMERVFDDEIKHVHLGVKWFQSDSRSLWQAHNESLVYPLSPKRAKGLGFATDVSASWRSRQRSGIDRDYFTQLKLYHRSKGRPSQLWFFNPTCELETANGSQHFTPKRTLQDLGTDLAFLPALLCTPGDSVIVPQMPSERFLETLQQCGLGLAEFIVLPNLTKESLRSLQKRSFAKFQPWGWSPRMEFVATQLGISSDVAKAEWLSKLWSRKIAQQIDLDPVSTVVTDTREIPMPSAHRAYVWKSIYGSGGQQNLIVRAPISAVQRKWAQRQLAKFGSFLCEPLHDRVADFGIVLDTAQEGSKARRPVGFTRFSLQGQTYTHFLGNLWHGIPASRRHNLQQELSRIGCAVAETLISASYRGPASIDAYLYRCGHSLKLRPLVEINARWTMSHIALKLEKRIHPEAIWAEWSHGRRDVPHDSPPLIKDRRIVHGVVATSEPSSGGPSLPTASWISVLSK